MRHGLRQVALVLAVLTALEISTYCVDFGPLVPARALLIMMVIKFLMVVLFFMHLQFDNKLFSWLFWVGVGPRRGRVPRRAGHVPVLRHGLIAARSDRRVRRVDASLRHLAVPAAPRGVAARRRPDRRVRLRGQGHRARRGVRRASRSSTRRQVGVLRRGDGRCSGRRPTGRCTTSARSTSTRRTCSST